MYNYNNNFNKIEYIYLCFGCIHVSYNLLIVHNLRLFDFAKVFRFK